MNEKVRAFLEEKRVAVLATQLGDLTPHAATVHFSHKIDPLTFLFLTDRGYRKCEKLNKEGSCNASVVVGFDESDKRTLQTDGLLSILFSQKEQASFRDNYFGKFPESKKYDDDDALYLSFVPHWGRFTDYNTDPKTEIMLTL